jgi:DNA-binding GntR family transcriptional regulator
MGPEPLKEQIAKVITARILDGRYELQRAIPGELALAAEFDVSRNTIRAAVQILVGQGLVKVVRGKGTYAVAKASAEDTDTSSTS